MLVVPYYNKPTQEGLYQHFKAVAEAVDIPIVLYNVPPRTGGDMQVETVIRLSKVKGIIGIKDASYDMARPTLTRLKTGKEFCQLSGEDASALGFLAQSGDGCISVTANVAPRLLGQMHDAWKARQIDKAIEINERLMPLHKALFVETNPGPVKYGAELLGKCSAEMRLPLVVRRGHQETGARRHGIRRPAQLIVEPSQRAAGASGAPCSASPVSSCPAPPHRRPWPRRTARPCTTISSRSASRPASSSPAQR